MSVEIKKDITTVTVEVPKTGVAIENAITNINVQVSQPQLTISQAGVSGRNGTSGTSGTSGNVLSSSFYISGSIIPNVADGDLTSSFSLGSSTNAWKDLWISKGTIYFIGDNNESASISINEENQIVISDINLSGSITASLAEGYLWVGGPTDKNIAIPTASLITGGSGTSGVDGTSGTSGLSITGSTGSHGTSGTSGISPTSIDGLISGSQQIYDLGFIGTSQAIVDTGSFATTGSNQFSGSQYIISGGLVFNNGVQIYESDDDMYIQSLSEIRVGANGNNYKFGNDGNFYTSVGGVVFGHDGLINQIPGASGDNINIVVGINDGIVLTTDAGDGDYVWDFDKNGDLTVPGNVYGAPNLATKGSNIFDGNQIMTGSLVVSGSADFTELRVTGDLNVLGKITGSLFATNGVISSSQQITDLGFVSSSTADTTQLNNFTGSIRAEIDGIEAYTASLKATTLISGAAQITALGFGAGGGDVTALNTYTSSNDVVLQRIMQTTASLNIVTGSFARIWQTTASLNTFTGSIRGEVNGLESYTASLKSATLVSSSTQIVNFGTFATLNANSFNGNQIITGSLTVSSTAISEATLFASASNLVLNSGSNLQINNSGLATINNRLQVSGSSILSGSTNLTGSVTINESRIDNGWTSYTPTWDADGVSNPSIADGTLTGAYKIIGKICFVRVKLNAGSSTTFGSGVWRFGLPFTASNADGIQMACSILDNGIAWYGGIANGTYSGFAHKTAIISPAAPIIGNVLTYSGVGDGHPMVWDATDSLQFAGSYEIA